jgi:chromosomal replication initiator protein
MQPGRQARCAPESSTEGSPFTALSLHLGAATVDHWFRGNTTLDECGDELSVRANSPFLLSWIQRHYKDALRAVASERLGPSARVVFDSGWTEPIVATGPGVVAPSASTTVEADDPGTGEPTTRATGGPSLPPATIGSPSAANTNNAVTPSFSRRYHDLRDFVAGPQSRVAVSAIEEFALAPQSAPNPVYIYGGVGIGKTHLLEGAYTLLRGRYPTLQAVYLTAENFANYFTQALRDHSLAGFRQRFRSVDVLLVDDVEFFDGKRGLQEEFVHTLRQLSNYGKRVILSADRHPRLLTRTSEDLKSRISAGLVTRLEAPDRATRRAMVERKLSVAGVDTDRIGEDVRDYVSDRFGGNVRELEGALHSLRTHVRWGTGRLSLSAARQALGDLERDCQRVVRLADVERVVTGLFGLTVEALRSPDRTKQVSLPRMLAMFLSRQLTGNAYSEIGTYFGGRNHSTVIAAARRIEKSMSTSEVWTVGARRWTVGELVDAARQQLLAS